MNCTTFPTSVPPGASRPTVRTCRGNREAPQGRLQLLGRLALLIGLLLSPTAIPLDQTAMADEGRAGSEQFFEKQVRPLLVARCFECHGEDAAESELRVDSLAGLLRGGVRGPAVIPGKPEDSLLIRAVRHGEVLKMPAKSKLPAQEIAALARWIADGARWPGQSADDVAAVPRQRPNGNEAPDNVAATFWAFQPVRLPALPTVRDRDGVQSPIDAFILARLEAAGLQPAPPADKQTLIRRATFLLLGLPPTPEEVQAFLADSSPDAFARVVDRLLASPQYGQRWGRHWLDVARYADSNGLDENLAYANAFRYRDYVVRAFNRDKPFDRFVQEQLAGDLLEPPADQPDSLDHLVATGFLGIGPKMLAEDDPVKLRMDIIDEQVDTLGRAILGMTLGCARCHDHKFDPISADDYYGLAGIFYSTKTMDTLTVVAQWHERPLADRQTIARRDEHQRQLAAVQATVAELRKQAAEELRRPSRLHVGDYLLAAESARRRDALLARTTPLGPKAEGEKLPDSVLLEAENYDRGNVLRDTTGYGQGIGVLVNQGQTPNFVEYDVQVPRAGQYRLEVRYAAASSRPCKLWINQVLVKSDVAGGVTGTWFPDSQRWEVVGFVPLKQGGNTLRLEHPQYFPHIDKLLLLPATEEAVAPLTPLDARFRPIPELVEQWSKLLTKEPADAMDPALAAWHEATGQNASEPRLRQLAGQYQQLVVDQAADASTAGAPGDKASNEASEIPVEQQDAFRRLVAAEDGPFRVPSSIDHHFAAATKTRLDELAASEKRLRDSLPEFPAAMSVTEDVAEDLRIHYRGSHLTLGPKVPRGFPAAISGGMSHSIGSGSGRRELAEWLTSPDHPLTARVLVNRVWQWHFGQGLVRSPDNFGQLGERPTHPELLDWLAVELVRSGWHLKGLHRTIMLSSAWQMSTTFDARGAEQDPENRLWWRRSRQRLEAEAIRDGLLAVSGNLDRQLHGSLLPTENRKYVTSTANVDPVVYVSNRRSIYLPVVRSALYDVFQAFDFADPSVINGQRQTTTVAPQALFMMNSSFVNAQTELLARSLLDDSGLSDDERVERLYALAYSRSPTAGESEQALAFVSEYQHRWRTVRPDAVEEAAWRAWQALCRVILAANEFVYLE